MASAATAAVVVVVVAATASTAVATATSAAAVVLWQVVGSGVAHEHACLHAVFVEGLHDAVGRYGGAARLFGCVEQQCAHGCCPVWGSAARPRPAPPGAQAGRGAPLVGIAKIAKGESSAKEKLDFLGIAEPPPAWAQPQIATGEREGRGNLDFPCLV